MTSDSRNGAEGAGQRKSLHPAMLAALWTVSNGRCYAPGCPMPVVHEVRPGVYRKNSQVAHIYGVRPGARRYRPDMTAKERDSFENLLLLCLPHHEDVDGDGADDLYPPETLRKWKADHEGAAGSVLNYLTVPSADALMAKLIELAEPPIERLEAIAQQLEDTGVVTSATVTELRQIIKALSTTDFGIDMRTAMYLSEAAEVLGASSLARTAEHLMEAADLLPSVAERLERVSGRLGDMM